MNELLKDGLMILSGIIGGTLFVLIKNYIIKKAKNKLVNGQTITQEPFSLTKFVNGMTTLKSGTSWAKDIHDIFNLRKLIIIGIIIGCIFGYGWYKGHTNQPVQLVIDEAVEFTIPVPHSDLALYKAKHSTELLWINTVTGATIGKVNVKDIPVLAKKLRPYGIDLRPFVTAGGSLGQTGTKAEAGLGMQWFKYFKWHLDSFLTNVGIYPLGVSYSITDNFDILAGAGIGYKGGDKRIYIGGKWKF